MKVLLKSAKIIDASSNFNGTEQDILIQEGTIIRISNSISDKNAITFNLPDLHLSQGWFDSSVSFGEPGLEERETLKHGLEVAAYSGFSHIAYNTNTEPRPDSKADIAFLQRKSFKAGVSLHPKATLTQNNNNKNLAELNDLKLSGAVCFSNHKAPIESVHLLKLALQYCQPFGGLIESFPINHTIAPKGIMHEGHMSTSLGLVGIPSLAEHIQIQRDLSVLHYTGGKLHIPTISSAKSVDLIRSAKKEGMDVSCSVSIHNLMFTDQVLNKFDTRFKLNPPLREVSDQKALIKGVKDGVIDMVTSDHQPINIEEKKMELEYAAYGSIGLETAFGVLLKLFGLQKSIDLLTKGKKRFEISEYPIDEGSRADLTLFTPKGSTEITKNNIMSSSKNSAYLGQKFNGKTYGIIANNEVLINQI